MKNGFLFLFLTLLFSACGNKPAGNVENKISYEITGRAQGTTFVIKYVVSDSVDVSDEVKKIFDAMDQQVSTYVDNSVISVFNSTNDTLRKLTEQDTIFHSLFERSKEIWLKTGGAFNPCVMPLVKYWGFSKEEKIPGEIDSLRVDSLVKLCDYSFFVYIKNTSHILVPYRGCQLDFNAIAQGYTVDLVCSMLLKKNIHNFMIELGGEVRASGKNSEGKTWKIGIDKPVDYNAEHQLQAIISLDNRALATSGNYRKFYVKNGMKYSHTINPQTGFPVNHNLLSATVLAPDCATADAYATAFMVMGVERTKLFLQENPSLKLDAYLIFSDEGGNFKTWLSDGIKARVEEGI